MTRTEAEHRRERLAQDQPEATWLVAETNPGDWTVVKVGLKPGDPSTTESTEERPVPAYPDDPRNVTERDRGGNWVGG